MPMMIVLWACVLIGLGSLTAKRPDNVQLFAKPLAGDLLVWHAAALRFAAKNPTYSGAIAASSLALPSWNPASGWWQSSIDTSSGRRVVSWGNSLRISAAELAMALGELSDDVTAGVALGGWVVPPGRPAVQTLPSGIPEGAAVVVTQLTP